jgi:SAM-dependent methyltransferase
MALLKIWRTIRRQGVLSALRKALTIGPAYLGGLRHWRLRRCQCCERMTLFMAHQNGSAEFRACLFCSANERYELLAAEIRHRYGKRLPEMDVLELDPHSPLRAMLSSAHSYTRTFYEEGCLGKERDGAVCEDICSLNFNNESFDLIVSSEVLEHVPDLDKAFRESARVLKNGGAHLFTVPPRATTKQRAQIVDRKIKHIEPPEYHQDPLSPEGILAFWDIGPDLALALPTEGLQIKIARGPAGADGRIVWIGERTSG